MFSEGIGILFFFRIEDIMKNLVKDSVYFWLPFELFIKLYSFLMFKGEVQKFLI